MAFLPLANILHYKLRSALSAMGIGLGICMLVALTGLSQGTVSEVADRWESVDADLIAYPKNWGDNVTTLSGIGLYDRFRQKFLADHPKLVERVVPVFLWQVKIGGQDNMSTGVDAADWAQLTRGKALLEGRLPDPDGHFAAWLEGKLLSSGDVSFAKLTEEQIEHEIALHGGLEMVIDSRLARKGGYRLGQTVRTGGHDWKIVGIVQDGVMTRVFMPRRTMQFFYGSGSILRSTLMFVKLRPGVNADAAATVLARDGADVIQLRQYRDKLQAKFGIMFVYINIVNAIALAIAFLFIMITLYMMVLQRTREIAILKSCGASNGFILKQVLWESLLLTIAGMAFGIALSFPVARLIELLAPLLTVQTTWEWIVVGVLAGLGGAILSALYPAWRATRVDMVEALTLE